MKKTAGGGSWVAWGCWGGGGGQGRGREEKRLLLERALLRQWETDSAPEGSSHYCGSEEIQVALLRGAVTAAARGNAEKAPAGADTTAAVGKYRESSCGSGHCCGSEEKTVGGSVWEGGGVRVMERRGCYGVSEVYSKGDGRLGSGGLP